MKNYESSLIRFVLKVVTAGVITAVLAVAAFAGVKQIEGHGEGFIDSATQEAQRNLENKCQNGTVTNVQVVSSRCGTPYADYCVVELIATCTTEKSK